MAVTTQKSTEYTNATATPVTPNNTTEMHGRERIMFFTHDQDGVGDAGSTVALGELPAGRVRIIGGLSRFYCNWTASSQTMDVGWESFTAMDGTTTAADPDGLVDGLDVDAVGYFSLESNVAAGKATGGTHVFESKDGVVIAAKAIAALASGDDLVGYITYIVD
jgi:hypothetical protein